MTRADAWKTFALDCRRVTGDLMLLLADVANVLDRIPNSSLLLMPPDLFAAVGMLTGRIDATIEEANIPIPGPILRELRELDGKGETEKGT